MNSKHDYIAVFDSGVGGVSVLRHLCRVLPREKFLYFGDSANAPYGTRPTDEIRALTLAAAEKLMHRDIKALVVACNTATSAAINDLRRLYPDIIIIGIEPALKMAADHFPGSTVGVMATPATLREEKFRDLMSRFHGICRTITLPSPGLVELVEQGRADSPEAMAMLEELLGSYRGKLSALVLGCTHYPFLADGIRQILGSDVALLDGGDGTARETRRRLEAADLLGEGPGQVLFENSSNDPAMVELCRQLLQQ